MAKHDALDLAQMQRLSLESKIRMAQLRIRGWYESWIKYEIYDEITKETRFVTHCEEPNEQGCFIKKNKRINGEMQEIDVLVPGTKLKKSEWIVSGVDGQVYVGFSGGIDSTVLKHIVDGMYKDVPSLFVNTGLEYPEIQQFVRDIKAGKYDCFNNNIEIIRPEMRFDEVIKNYGFPVISKEVAKMIKEGRTARKLGKKNYYAIQKLEGRLKNKEGNKSQFNCEKYRFLLDSDFKISHQCCDVMKKRPIKQYEKETARKPFIGTMAGESRQRLAQWQKFGCNAFEKTNPSSQPLSFWTKQDIYHYIKKYMVPYCPVYGDIVIDDRSENAIEGQINMIDYLGNYEQGDLLKTTGCNRTGCIFCMFGCHLEKEPNRFQRLKETHPRQYEYCINGGEYNDAGQWQPSKEGLGLGKVLDYINVKY